MLVQKGLGGGGGGGVLQGSEVMVVAVNDKIDRISWCRGVDAMFRCPAFAAARPGATRELCDRKTQSRVGAQ